MIETPHGPIDARDGEVSLAEMPFVRLRDGLPDDLLEGRIRFHDAVDAAQRAVAPLELVIDLPAGRVCAGGRVFSLPPVQLAFLAWLARRQKEGLPWLPSPLYPSPGHKKVELEPQYADHFLREYDDIVGEMGVREHTAKRLERGMDGHFFQQTKSRLNGSLKKAFDRRREAVDYLVSKRKEGRWHYGLEIPAQAIRFGGIQA